MSMWPYAASVLTICAFLVAAAMVMWFAAIMLDLPSIIHARRRDRACVTCRGDVSAVLAADGDILCREHRATLDRIEELEWSELDRTGQRGPSISKVIWR